MLASGDPGIPVTRAAAAILVVNLGLSHHKETEMIRQATLYCLIVELETAMLGQRGLLTTGVIGATGPVLTVLESVVSKLGWNHGLTGTIPP